VTTPDLLREAWGSLVAHRLRALLSIVGIVAGVGTIVAAFAITSGARQQAVAEIGALGIDNLIIRAAKDTDGRGKARAPALTKEDAAILGSRFSVATVSALRSVRDAAVFSDRTVPITVAGVTAGWRETAKLALASGRWIDADDVGARTAVMTGALARYLFGSQDPLGQQVLAGGEWRTVVGLLVDGSNPSAHSAIQTIDPDRTLFVPLGSLDLSLGVGDTGEAVDQIVMRFPGGTDLRPAARAVSSLLTEQHRDEPEGFELVVPQELLRARLQENHRFYLLLFAIGGLALVISGVGIMNIMVASVAERTTEIGVRRAFGARRSAIIRQFATEAALLSAAGGLVGVPLGVAMVLVAAWLAGWPVAVSAAGVLGSLGLALGVGLAAGMYPAHLAASLSPTDALRQ
jgi:putative ABC transport system permease protein